MSRLEKLFAQVEEQQQHRREWREGDSPEIIAERIVEEAQELVDSIQLFDLQEHPILEMAGEIGDVLYLVGSLCAMVGIDAADALEQKVLRNAVKYPDTHLSNGWEREQAIYMAKSSYSAMGGDKAWYGWYTNHFPNLNEPPKI